MSTITFVTGNLHKAAYLKKLLWINILHQKLDLDEIQSLELRDIVEHKARQAYDRVQSPVLVDDVSLEFRALGRLPGPFIKFFQQELSLEEICDLLDNKDRAAIARCGYGYYDEDGFRYFENALSGSIAFTPKWQEWFWWDQIFIPEWWVCTAAELSPEEYDRYYLRVKPIEKVRDFLTINMPSLSL